ncbi:hypothetical protein BDB01DRAFT_855200 [Pilobolus umbonatus]|nr:hypothetical protein BDB01DRAFT_855200 [Pilobolus umbonatus]
MLKIELNYNRQTESNLYDLKYTQQIKKMPLIQWLNQLILNSLNFFLRGTSGTGIAAQSWINTDGESVQDLIDEGVSEQLITRASYTVVTENSDSVVLTALINSPELHPIVVINTANNVPRQLSTAIREIEERRVPLPRGRPRRQLRGVGRLTSNRRR